MSTPGRLSDFQGDYSEARRLRQTSYDVILKYEELARSNAQDHELHDFSLDKLRRAWNELAFYSEHIFNAVSLSKEAAPQTAQEEGRIDDASAKALEEKAQHLDTQLAQARNELRQMELLLERERSVSRARSSQFEARHRQDKAHIDAAKVEASRLAGELQKTKELLTLRNSEVQARETLFRKQLSTARDQLNALRTVEKRREADLRAAEKRAEELSVELNAAQKERLAFAKTTKDAKKERARTLKSLKTDHANAIKLLKEDHAREVEAVRRKADLSLKTSLQELSSECRHLKERLAIAQKESSQTGLQSEGMEAKFQLSEAQIRRTRELLSASKRDDTENITDDCSEGANRSEDAPEKKPDEPEKVAEEEQTDGGVATAAGVKHSTEPKPTTKEPEERDTSGAAPKPTQLTKKQLRRIRRRKNKSKGSRTSLTEKEKSASSGVEAASAEPTPIAEDESKSMPSRTNGAKHPEAVALSNLHALDVITVTLHVLFAIPNFRNAVLGSKFLRGVKHTSPRHRLALALRKTFGQMSRSDFVTFAPKLVWEALGGADKLPLDEGRDALIFVSTFLDDLSGSLGPHFATFVEDSFHGSMHTRILCTKCGFHIRNSPDEIFLCLQIRPLRSFEEALLASFEGTILPANGCISCGKCKKQVREISRVAVPDKLPTNLVVEVNRLGPDGKCHDRMTFPRTLDMAPYTKRFIFDGGEHSSNKPRKAGDSHIYELTGVIIHEGLNLAGRHYCVVRSHKSPSTGDWRYVKLDNGVATALEDTDADIDHWCFGGHYEEAAANLSWEERLMGMAGIESARTRAKTWNARMLFYTRKKAS